MTEREAKAGMGFDSAQPLQRVHRPAGDDFCNLIRPVMAPPTAAPGARPRIALFAHTPRTREYGRRALRLLGCVPLVFLNIEEFLRMGSRTRELALVFIEHGEEDVEIESPPLMKLGDKVRKTIGDQLPILHSFAAASGGAIPGFRVNDAVLPASQSFAQLCRTLAAFMKRRNVPTTEIRLMWGGHRFCIETGNVHIGNDTVQLKPEEFDLALELFFNIGTRISRAWLRTMVPAMQTLRRRPTGVAPDYAILRLRDVLNLEPIYGWELQITPGLSCRLVKLD